MVWKIDDLQGNEAQKIKYEIVPYTRGRGLDLGCGMYKTYKHFIGVDNKAQWDKLNPSDEYMLRLNVDIEANCEKLDMFASQSMDFVFSSHLLEHMEDPLSALKEWWRVIKHNGYLILYLPHRDFYPNIGEDGANPDHKHDFKPSDIIQMMGDIGGWDLVKSENRNKQNEYSFLQIFQKLSSFKHFYSYNQERPSKTCAVVRYGGFGDMVQTSSILPHLKDQGYHITMFTTPRGHNIVKHDPHIDEFFIQDKDQVPNEEIVPFWDAWKPKFDKWINLSESVEGTFLAMKGRTLWEWPDHARHAWTNRNYLEYVHIIAGVPQKYKTKFYPTRKEILWAEKRYKKIGKCILWVLDGSSVHKHWPWMDNAIARILLNSDYKIITVGNKLSAMLEMGWENEPRVITKSGKWDIRKTLTFAQTCDMVVGPETGVLNAVGLMGVPKIVFLSHSSEENLTKHWKNCYPLIPEGCQCYPCHKMIHGWDDCKRSTTETPMGDKTLLIEGADCQVKIDPAQFGNAFNEAQRN